MGISLGIGIELGIGIVAQPLSDNKINISRIINNIFITMIGLSFNFEIPAQNFDYLPLYQSFR